MRSTAETAHKLVALLRRSDWNRQSITRIIYTPKCKKILHLAVNCREDARNRRLWRAAGVTCTVQVYCVWRDCTGVVTWRTSASVTCLRWRHYADCTCAGARCCETSACSTCTRWRILLRCRWQVCDTMSTTTTLVKTACSVPGSHG